MTKLPMIEGGCLCGLVRYRLKVPPTHLGDCHCLDCRRASGAPYVTWGSVAREDLEILSGEVRTIHFADRIRSFAGCCGTPLFFDDGSAENPIDVTIASLDDPTPFAPESAIWTEDRLPWVNLPPHQRSFPQDDGS
ncbi:MAG: GFA family protein [Verrucomicrobiae bacterium]|nr:GFA family protein [Verrucomicrobiae bacterium]